MWSPHAPQQSAGVPSYAPIRTQIAAALAPEDRDQDTVTEICLLVAAIAHGKESAWLQERGHDLGVEEAQQWLQTVNEVFAEEIAAVLHVSQALDTLLVASWVSQPAVDAGVNMKLSQEFFEMPAAARRHLGWV